MIKIVREDQELSEDRLNQMEDEGLILISVNTHTTEEFAVPMESWCPGMNCGMKNVEHWVYHFRTAAEYNLRKYISTLNE